MVRDCVNPNKDLGHSDNNIKQNLHQKMLYLQPMNSIEKKQSDDQQPSPSSQKIPSIFNENNQISIEYSVGSSIESPDNNLYQATYYANELLSMIYERNAWWKMKEQTGEECHANDNGEDDEAMPAAVDLVTLIPNRIVVKCW